MLVARTIAEARRQRRDAAGTVALVPTMGALHAGHLALVEQGRTLADHVFVSIFVNPTQFAPHEDFARYPRPLEQDLRMCEQAGVAGVLAPPVEEIYPPDALPAQVEVPALAQDLEGIRRPTHFAGVCRVVMKLLNIYTPDVAIFGQKDFQQLRIIQAMVADLMMPVEVVAAPTRREPDGLAMSSRNRYLDEEDRRHAPGLYKALTQAKMLVEDSGEADPAVVERAMRQVMEAHHVDVDYAVVRHPHTLATLDCLEPALTGGVVALVAGRLGKVRLIDNMLLGAPAA